MYQEVVMILLILLYLTVGLATMRLASHPRAILSIWVMLSCLELADYFGSSFVATILAFGIVFVALYMTWTRVQFFSSPSQARRQRQKAKVKSRKRDL